MRAPGNAVLLTLVIVLAAALAATGFVAQAPNRLVTGAALPLWRATDPVFAAAIAALTVALLVAAFVPPTKRLAGTVIAAATVLLLLLLDAAGAAAASLAALSPAAARTSLGPAFWIAGLCASFAIVDALQRLDTGPLARLVIVAAIVALLGAMIASGRLDHLSLVREYAARRGAFVGELMRHCELVLGAVLPALALGVPLGLLAARRVGARGPLFAVLNMVQTVPSIALFGLLLAPLAALAVAVPALAALGIRGIGMAPALIALLLYSLLPVARNTLAGLEGVDRAVVEAASGMGMTPRQIFWRIELPLGMPVFLAGVRIVLVQAIGLAAVAALVGAGGLGTFVFQGIGQYAIDLVLLGAVPTILLALAADFVLAILIEGDRPMIELEHVVKLHGATRVVDDVSFTVEPGAFCALVGSSGAGKSTTLKMVNRLIPMSAGTIRIGGEDVTRLPPEALRRRIGYVIQSIGLFPHWTVVQNIATVPRLLGWAKERIDARVAELMALLRLDPAEHGGKYPHELSGGQQQRIGVARALAADPELLLMDEPFGALDPITREALAAELALIHRRTKQTIVFVTHDLDMALARADVIAIMHQGRLRQFAPPRDILEHPADDFVRDFVGRAGLGLKLLGVRKVAEAARPEGTAPGEPIDQSASLAEALSEMVVRHAERVPVRGADGAVAGTVALGDLVR